MSRPIYLNESFRGQRVSGQQRYAGEIADQLPDDVRRLRPGRFFAAHPFLTWFWVLVVLPIRAWPGVLVSLTARSPIWHPRQIAVVHDLFVVEHPEWYSRAYYLTHAPLLRIQVATARALVAVSEPVATQLRGRRPSADVVVAPNAPSRVFDRNRRPGPVVPASRPGPTGPEILDRWGLRPGRYLIAVGNIDPRKNWSRLARAWSRRTAAERADVPLVVVGAGSMIYNAPDVEWPAETRLIGYVTDDELATLYAESMAFVFPSLAEGFGLPIVEAVGAGAPRLLLADLPVFRWICGGAAGYVDPTSVNELADALRTERIAALPPADPQVAGRFDWASSAATVHRQARALSDGSAR